MISPERREELEAIAYEIFDALSCERYEPSERGAGWAPTDKGYEDVIAVLARAKARLWRDSPAEKRKYAITKAKKQAKRVAEKLLGSRLLCNECFDFGSASGYVYFSDMNCSQCGKMGFVYKAEG